MIVGQFGLGVSSRKLGRNPIKKGADINSFTLLLSPSQLTVSQVSYSILQLSGRKMERPEKLFNSGFASRFNEFTDRSLQVSQAYCCFKPRHLATALA